jgi:ferritin
MLLKNIEKELNHQVKIEAESSQTYLSMACWAENQGLEGIASFMYKQSDEERMHMLKLVKYINERGGHAHITDLKAPKTTFTNFKEMFQELYNHEVFVSESINELVHITLSEKDYATHNFLQWYVAEQIEEEAQAKTILDKISLIGDDKGGLYLFDRDIMQLTVTSSIDINPK